MFGCWFLDAISLACAWTGHAVCSVVATPWAALAMRGTAPAVAFCTCDCNSTAAQAFLHTPLLRSFYLLVNHTRATCPVSAGDGCCMACELVRRGVGSGLGRGTCTPESQTSVGCEGVIPVMAFHHPFRVWMHGAGRGFPCRVLWPA